MFLKSDDIQPLVNLLQFPVAPLENQRVAEMQLSFFVRPARTYSNGCNPDHLQSPQTPFPRRVKYHCHIAIVTNICKICDESR